VTPAPTKLTTFSRWMREGVNRKVRRAFSNAPLTSCLLFPTSACAARWHGFGVKGLKWK
jgi:hypothetical protein